MKKTITIDEMAIGSKAIIKKLYSEDPIRRRLLDIGMIEGTTIEAALESPGKDPIAYLVRGALIAIRKEDAMKIVAERIG